MIGDFETWIKLGAADPRKSILPESLPAASLAGEDIDWEQARQFWAFQPPTEHDPPLTENKSWASGRIDQFVLAELEQAGVAPNPAADKRTWIRRLTFDLTGLPPTPEQVNAFLEDQHPGAKRRLVDRLLETPRARGTLGTALARCRPLCGRPSP